MALYTVTTDDPRKENVWKVTGTFEIISAKAVTSIIDYINTAGTELRCKDHKADDYTLGLFGNKTSMLIKHMLPGTRMKVEGVATNFAPKYITIKKIEFV